MSARDTRIYRGRLSIDLRQSNANENVRGRDDAPAYVIFVCYFCVYVVYGKNNIVIRGGQRNTFL